MLCIWVKCVDVWGNYPNEMDCLHSVRRFYVTLKEFTPDWGKFTNEMGQFHKALPNVKSAYVTLKDFTPDLQKIYTDISAISVTLCNSVYSW